VDGKKKGQKNAGSKKKNNKNKASSLSLVVQRKAGAKQGTMDLTARLFATMEKLKEVCFVHLNIRLICYHWFFYYVYNI